MKQFHNKVRIQVRTDSGLQVTYVDSNQAKTLHDDMLRSATESGARLIVKRKSRVTGNKIDSTVSLLRDDGSPFYIAYHDEKKKSISIRVGQSSTSATEGMLPILRKRILITKRRNIKEAYDNAVNILSEHLNLPAKSEKVLLTAYPAFLQRYDLK